MRRNLFIFTGILLLILPQFLFAQSLTVAVLTPFLAQPGTQLMVEGFEAAAKSKGWQVDVIDTSGDVAALVSRMEDVALQKVDAIVINVDPSQIRNGLLAAKDAGIPVFGMDSGADPLLTANVTSNGYVMAAETATYVVYQLNGKGNVVMFILSPTLRCKSVEQLLSRSSTMNPTSKSWRRSLQALIAVPWEVNVTQWKLC